MPQQSFAKHGADDFFLSQSHVELLCEPGNLVVRLGGQQFNRMCSDQQLEIFVHNSAIRIADITDGTSNTALLAESLGYIPAGSREFGYNTVSGYRGRAISTQTRLTVKPNATLPTYRGGPGSHHVGGIHLLMGDGISSFVNEAINITLFGAIGTRNGNETLGEF